MPNLYMSVVVDGHMCEAVEISDNQFPARTSEASGEEDQSSHHEHRPA